jgi:hypothetical protein
LEKGEEGLVVKLGITGHQKRDGIDWEWVRLAIGQELGRYDAPLTGLTSLAVGADQIFAEAVLERGGSLLAVVPRNDYQTYFEGEGLDRYRQLVNRSNVIHLHVADEQQAFLEAGLYVADHSDCLLAVWDGEGSKGKGGTADVVAHVASAGAPWVHIDPIRKRIVRHDQS